VLLTRVWLFAVDVAVIEPQVAVINSGRPCTAHQCLAASHTLPQTDQGSGQAPLRPVLTSVPPVTPHTTSCHHDNEQQAYLAPALALVIVFVTPYCPIPPHCTPSPPPTPTPPGV
jgi:hypothetical protein